MTAPAGRALADVVEDGAGDCGSDRHGLASIYDLGYRGYDGTRYGAPHRAAGTPPPEPPGGVRDGRGGRAKVAPFLLLTSTGCPHCLRSGSRRS